MGSLCFQVKSDSDLSEIQSSRILLLGNNYSPYNASSSSTDRNAALLAGNLSFDLSLPIYTYPGCTGID